MVRGFDAREAHRMRQALAKVPVIRRCAKQLNSTWSAVSPCGDAPPTDAPDFNACGLSSGVDALRAAVAAALLSADDEQNADATPEALAYLRATGWRSAGMRSA